jgi:hypothetical protein
VSRCTHGAGATVPPRSTALEAGLTAVYEVDGEDRDIAIEVCSNGSEVRREGRRGCPQFDRLVEGVSMPRRDVIAYHEAGHAVVARRLGISIAHITMVPTADARASMPSWSAAYAARDAPLSSQVAALQNDAKVSLAGPNAQHRRRPVKNQERAREEEWCDDFEHAQKSVASAVHIISGGTLPAEGQIAITLGPAAIAEINARMRRINSEARALVAENWPAIVRVARALLKRHTLSQEDVDTLIEPPNP